MKKYKTFQEMYENRPNDLPFLYTPELKECYVIEVIPIDDNTFFNKLFQTKIFGQIKTFKDVHWKDCTMIDWFEDNSKINNGICSCDLFTVLMVTGCKCGGK